MRGLQQFEEIKALLGESQTYYVIAVDMDANYIYLNRHYSDVFEPIHGDLIGKYYAVTMHQDDQQTCKIVSQLAFMYGNSVFPATLRKHDGKGGFIMTRWEYKAMFDENGAPVGVFCIGYDITELMQISGELQEIKMNHSHSVRLHVANLIGLGKLIQEATEIGDIQDAAAMIVQSATKLDVVVRKLS
jgi:PAS domain S-box-containing protein